MWTRIVINKWRVQPRHTVIAVFLILLPFCAASIGSSSLCFGGRYCILAQFFQLCMYVLTIKSTAQLPIVETQGLLLLF